MNLNKILPNFRDIGGLIGYGGKHLKRGLFYRSSALYKLNSKQQIVSFKKLGIKTICDLRQKYQQEKHPDPYFEGVKINNISALPFRTNHPEGVKTSIHEYYRAAPFDSKAFKAMFQDIIDRNVPILVQCNSGKDRTGIAAALIQKLFGVSKELIIKDYMKVNETAEIQIKEYKKQFGLNNTNDQINMFVESLFLVKRQYIEETFRAIEQKYPSYDEYYEKEYGITNLIKDDLYQEFLE